MARWLGIAKILILFCSSQASAQLNFRFFQPVEPPRNIQVMVHRGMAMAAPENSAAAIEMCVQDYCEWAEIDLRLTKDGRHVVIHNDTVDATTDGKGRIADLTLDELKKLDAGSWFAQRFSGNRLMTLSEALALAKGRINLYLDCKHIDAKLLVEEVIAAGMERQPATCRRTSVPSRRQQCPVRPCCLPGSKRPECQLCRACGNESEYRFPVSVRESTETPPPVCTIPPCP